MEQNELLEQMKAELIEVNKKLDFFIEVYNTRFSSKRYADNEVKSVENFNPLKED